MRPDRADADPEAWFLTASERGNPGTQIDRRRNGGRAWTAGNEVTVHVDGASYFRRLHQVLSAASPGDQVWFTDWQGEADERLDGPGTEVGRTLGALAQRGVHVRGLLWRSHPKQAGFGEQDNMALALEVNEHGGELVLDHRVRRAGSHHQKIVVVGRLDPAGPDDVAFAGGIDLCHGRGDDHRHGGDDQPTDELDDAYGDRPPWHDAQLEVRGPAVGDLAWTFHERWSDPSPLDHRNPIRSLQRRAAQIPRRLSPLPEPQPDGRGTGPHLVQVLRTYPPRRPRFPFAPDGERSIARAHLKALRRARRLVVIEDQYLWSAEAAEALAAALRRHADLHVVIVVPRHPDQGDGWVGTGHHLARGRFIRRLHEVEGAAARVGVYDLVNRSGTPIYVHAKVAIVDDVWLEVGSDNLNRRSWTHDSEIACAVLDERLDPREPRDPGGQGDGARVLARTTRLALWGEHLGRAEGDDADLVDPAEGFAVLRDAAEALTRWEDGGGEGPRPPGHLTVHRPEPVAPWRRPVAELGYRLALDPEGRRRADRRARRH